ncbi:MAG: RNA polymerase sigma factor [Melioribacteraceae bacterium]|nr:MAG: RNA polymerase sigma factor [Melioribacteraceae bacterium]
MSKFSKQQEIMPVDTDFELVKKFLIGDESAFNKLAANYQKKIYWHARRMLGNHLDADEVTQEVLIVLYEKLHTFNFQSSLFTWIYRITSTRSLNFIKKKSIKKFLMLDDSDTTDLASNNDIMQNIEDKEKLDKLNNVLQKLPAKQREIFIMRQFDQLSYEEIAEIKNKSIGTLKANYFHAIKKVTEMMNNG